MLIRSISESQEIIFGHTNDKFYCMLVSEKTFIETLTLQNFYFRKVLSENVLNKILGIELKWRDSCVTLNEPIEALS